ncbi:MAG: hypothetical protein HY537_13845 [Deltaproteobacteria bacterium]|nr:hypothetical protein [Deltaproteobacteria bacterium]
MTSTHIQFPQCARNLRRKQVIILAILLALEFMLALYLLTRDHTATRLGYLVKIGNSYLVAWKKAQSEYGYHSFSNLNEALDYSKQVLGLSEGRPVTSDIELERAWIQDRFGQYVVFWKTSFVPLLLQWSFIKEDDANYFYNAIRRGAYTPSPFGHSIMLIPAAKS